MDDHRVIAAALAMAGDTTPVLDLASLGGGMISAAYRVRTQ